MPAVSAAVPQALASITVTISKANKAVIFFLVPFVILRPPHANIYTLLHTPSQARAVLRRAHKVARYDNFST
jgi:hypothetical protein